MSIDWKIPAVALIVFAVLFPRIQDQTASVNLRLEEAKKKLLVQQDLLDHREDYLLIQKEWEMKGENLWGSFQPGDFMGELEAVSKQTDVPIVRMEPLAPNPESPLALQLQIESSMNAIGKFLYQALRLPGRVSVDQLILREASTPGVLQADILISRKTAEQK